MATIGELLEVASQCHRAGDFSRAEQFYRQILGAIPAHGEALHLLGILAHQTNRSPAAISSIRQAIELDPLNANYCFDLGRVYQEINQLSNAAIWYRQALQINAEFITAHNNLGNVLKDLGEVGEAIECYRQAIRIDPHYAAAHYNLGNVLVAKKQLAEAILCYRQVLRINPSHVAAHYNLGNALFEQERFADAILSYRQALRLIPNQTETNYNLGNALARQGNLDEAIECYFKALHLNPEHGEVRFNLGNAYCERGQIVEAEKWYRDALRINPSHVQTHNNLGNALKAQGKPDQAALAFREALRLKPASPEILYNLATCLHEQGAIDQAITFYRQALGQRPDYADASNNLAKALKEKGLLSEALLQIRYTLELQADHAQAYSNLSEFVAAGHAQFRPEEVAKITALLNSGRGSALDRSLFSHTMATLCHVRGNYDEAFQFYRQANDLRRHLLQQKNASFDGLKHRRFVDQIIDTYNWTFFERVKGWGIDTDVPVFIVGMPRSGSTLIEQILSSHPQVFGAGELGALPRFGSQMAGLPQIDIESTPIVPPDKSAAREMANDYQMLLKQIGDKATRVANKTLDNFLHLGLIATLFPRARIVHCRRDPLDTCLSCYFQNFKTLNFTTSFEDIATYYCSYKKLMAYWSQVLPLSVHEVCYEELAYHPKAVILDLLGYCGLDWDERCLLFYENSRAVQTASSIQVRAPIYKQAIGRWRNYRKHLDPLLSALGVQE